MGIKGKYDFPGIRKAGTAALKVVLAGTSWGSSLMAGPFRPLIELILGHLLEYLANKGLIIINLGAIYVNGELDQSRFDQAMESAIEKAKIPGMSSAQKKVIDDQVKNAFRRFARIGSDSDSGQLPGDAPHF